MFRLSAHHDPDALAVEFSTKGRIRIRDFLEDATSLARHLDSRQDWKQVINAGEKLFELSRADRASFSTSRIEALDKAVFEGARSGFQFRFESIRVSDEMMARDAAYDPLTRFVEWLGSDPLVSFFHRITGHREINFVDGQATRFSDGDFLTMHDDAVMGKHRRAAYVLGLTPGWNGDWGGLLMFPDDTGEQVSGMVPAFNTLDLFAVPVPHNVSLVSKAAARSRVSVTGWLRETR